MKKNVEIEQLKTIEELEECADLQKAIWGFEDREIVPVNELVAITHSGGFVLGAWNTKKEELVGFLFGMLGLENDELYHVSRMMGVIPDFRESNVAFELKAEQRKRVLEQGYDRITWTYDPLLSVNAYFNIEKLGVDVESYQTDVYGNSSSWMNQGWATDRFVIEWNIDSDNVKTRMEDRTFPDRNILEIMDNDDYTRVNEVEYDYNDIPHPDSANLDFQRNNLLVQIPRNISFIKSQELDLAREWREHTRAIFKEYFRRDYEIEAFISGKVEEPRKYRSFYLLTR